MKGLLMVFKKVQQIEFILKIENPDDKKTVD